MTYGTDRIYSQIDPINLIGPAGPIGPTGQGASLVKYDYPV